MTKEQITKINNSCSNNWKLDIEFLMTHGEKTLEKQIDIDKEHYLEFVIRYNYKNQISLHISKYFHKQGEIFASTTGLGKSIILESTPAPRKNINKLIEQTRKLNDTELLEINKNTKVTKSDGLFLESEEF